MIRNRVLPANHVAIPRTRLDLTKALVALQRYEEAGAELQQAETQFLAAHDTTATDRQTLGQLATQVAAAGKSGAIEVR